MLNWKLKFFVTTSSFVNEFRQNILNSGPKWSSILEIKNSNFLLNTAWFAWSWKSKYYLSTLHSKQDENDHLPKVLGSIILTKNLQ